MSQVIELAVAYTHNTRADYRSKINAEMEIKKDGDDIKLVLPNSVPQEILNNYKKGKTLFIVGEEVVENIFYGIDQHHKLNYYPFEAEGLVSIEAREFRGSNSFGGFYKILDISGNEITIAIAADLGFEDDGVIESFNGTIAISAWRETDAVLKPIVEYSTTQQFGSGLVSEKVKNYSYQLSASKGRMNEVTGLPHELTLPLKRFKKLPNAYHKQLKELIYVF